MHDSTATPVTVIGLGSMGSALAKALVGAGHPTTVWNRTPERAEPLARAGAQVAATVAEAVAASPLVITCLTDFDQTRAALAPAEGELPGRALVTLNTGSPVGARATAEWAAANRARFLAGAIKNVPAAVGAEDTLLYFGGERSVFDEYQATIRVLGGDTEYLGEEPDLAALYEAAVGAMLLPALMGFFQGAAVIQSRGLKAASMVRFTQKWIDMIRMIVPAFAEQIDHRDYTNASSSVNLFLAAQKLDTELAEETGVDVTWHEPMFDRLRSAAALGYGDQEISAVTEVLRQGHP
ncbi:NAD(P)-dependent oxidoreductase [Spiractinospora alimapuensis]|uniref:NAD(P)-dependent oxidoreductase n=1 Tax=Spiractinospora alimapuensis TaxID=2820884 RepID=UPI001F2E88F6|nr:NAD(P)-binding domain-containing protein [Spiractinospora alimapuensis]QVQ50072.1 NAD(P)-dependent oxidoreductase [Spiractinospora alimapuensis]